MSLGLVVLEESADIKMLSNHSMNGYDTKKLVFIFSTIIYKSIFMTCHGDNT